MNDDLGINFLEKSVTETVQNYKDLIVWQKAMDVVDQVYVMTDSFPKHELYGLTSQMR